MDRTYTGSYGRLKSSLADFLPNQFFENLIGRDLESIQQILSQTSYKEDLDALASQYRLPEILDLAINRHLISKNRLAQFAPPSVSRRFLQSYFLKWDIENVKSLISAKVLDYNSQISDSFIISYRNLPLGVFAGVMTREDFNIMASLGSVEAVVDYLTKFGIGSYMLQYIDEYRKTKDVTPLFSAMDRYHYNTMLENLIFYNGDEAFIRDYVRALVDSHNILSVLKGIHLALQWDQLKGYVFPNGHIPMTDLEEALRAGRVEDACQHFSRYYDLTQPLQQFSATGLVFHFDLHLKNLITREYMQKMASSPVSLNSIFHFILKAETERTNLRAVVAGSLYKLSSERIREMLILV